MPKIVDREKMQRSIMDAAKRVYLEKGFHSTTIADVAEAAGLGKGTLYLYFDNKESLAGSIMRTHFSEMERDFFRHTAPDTLEAFAKILKATMKISNEKAQFIRLVFEVFGPKYSSNEFSADVGVFFDRLGAHYAEHIQHLQSLGKIRKDADPKHLGRLLAATLDGIILHRGLYTLPESRHANMRAEFAELFIRGLAVDDRIAV